LLMALSGLYSCLSLQQYQMLSSSVVRFLNSNAILDIVGTIACGTFVPCLEALSFMSSKPNLYGIDNSLRYTPVTFTLLKDSIL
jgi:hypothetical protein